MVAIPVRLIAGTTDACLKSLTPAREGLGNVPFVRSM